MKVSRIIFSLISIASLISCGTEKLYVSDVSYQSIRNVKEDLIPKDSIPLESSILIEPYIDSDGSLTVNITNLTDEIMIIDRTKSFFVSPSGVSTMYYDPAITTETNSHTVGNGKEINVNVGAIAGALGAGGPVGQILNGVNVGGSTMASNSITNTTYNIDQPQISLSPKSRTGLGRSFNVEGIGSTMLKALSKNSNSVDLAQTFDKNQSYSKFSICISYSINGGKYYDKIVSSFYANSIYLNYVKNKGKVNESLRSIMYSKQDLLNEPWFLLYFNSNTGFNRYYSNNLYDYK